jgi:hypothetical protein
MWEKEKWPLAVPNVTTSCCEAAETAETGKLCHIAIFLFYCKLCENEILSFKKPTLFSVLEIQILFYMESVHETPVYTHTRTEHTRTYRYTYSFTDSSSTQIGFNVEFVAKRAKLQYAIKSISKLPIMVHKISKNMVNYKEKDHIYK